MILGTLAPCPQTAARAPYLLVLRRRLQHLRRLAHRGPRGHTSAAAPAPGRAVPSSARAGEGLPESAGGALPRERGGRAVRTAAPPRALRQLAQTASGSAAPPAGARAPAARRGAGSGSSFLSLPGRSFRDLSLCGPAVVGHRGSHRVRRLAPAGGFVTRWQGWTPCSEVRWEEMWGGPRVRSAEEREGAKGRFLPALSFRSLYLKTGVQVTLQNLGGCTSVASPVAFLFLGPSALLPC